MNIIRIIVEEHIPYQGEIKVVKAEKVISRVDYDRFTWSTMAEILFLTVVNLDEKISEEKKKLEE